MAASAIGLLCLIFILMFLQSNMNEKGQTRKSDRTVPALGPKEARPAALDLTFQLADGTKTDLKTLQGKVVHLNFWASWCQPCLTELPMLQALHRKIPGYVPVLINMDYGDEAIAEAKKLLSELAPDLATHFSNPQALQQKFVVEVLPYHLLVDKNGRTAAAFYSRLDEKHARFRELLTQLLDE